MTISPGGRGQIPVRVTVRSRDPTFLEEIVILVDDGALRRVLVQVRGSVVPKPQSDNVTDSRGQTFPRPAHLPAGLPFYARCRMEV